VVAFYGLATLLLTWPLAFSAGRAVSTRPDYIVHLWNAWWVRTAVFERGISPYWTDFLHAPVGVSLAHHTLSLPNALVGAALSYILDPHDVFRLLLFVHFWLSAWIFFLFAKEITGSFGGSLLAGLLWSFNPYHAYYLPQLNLATLEVLPLFALFTVRSYRRGGVGNGVGVVLSAGLLAGSDGYYLVYAGLLGCLLVLGGALWDPRTPWARGARRLVVPALGAIAAAAVASWPLISQTTVSMEAQVALGEHAAKRSNDLVGFLWVGGPERLLVAWPVMCGYTTLLLLLAGFRGVLRQWFWLLAAALFFVLSLGPELLIDGSATGFPMPYRLISELPLLGMLRKPDRFFVMFFFAVTALAAFAWKDLAARLRVRPVRMAIGGSAAVLMAIELCPAPLNTFPVEISPYFQRLAEDETVRMLVELPAKSSDARPSLAQTVHHKRIAQGSVTSLALTPENRHELSRWKKAHRALRLGDPEPMRVRLRGSEVDLVVLHKTRLRSRAQGSLAGTIVWRPFPLVRSYLIDLRQRTQDELAVPSAELRRQIQALTEMVGPPEYEDHAIVVFRNPWRTSGG
jgi:hypothetical protein